MIPAGILISASAGLLMGPQAGAMAVTAGAAMAVCARLRASLHNAMAVTTATAVLFAALPVYPFPVFMRAPGEEIEPVAGFYVDMGMEPAMVDRVLSTMQHLSPGIGAIQTALGSMAAVMLLNAMGRGKSFQPSRRFMMGWQISWVLIACLAVRAIPQGIPLQILRAADNVLLFMALPYLIQGGAVALKWASAYPGMTAVFLIALVLITPVVIMGTTLTGVLDTWFDFRKRIEMRAERLNK